MNDEEKARGALVYIYQQTTVEAPELSYDGLVQAMNGITNLPEAVQNVRFPDQQAFVAALEDVAKVVSIQELQITAKLAPTLEIFERQMQALFRLGELPVEWALMFKKFKGNPGNLELLQKNLRSRNTD